MSANDALQVFSAYSPELMPVPAAHAAPLERLIATAREGHLALLLCADPEVSPDWLTAARIEEKLSEAAMESLPARIWPLLSSVWVISLEMQANRDDPLCAFTIQSLQRALTEHLEEAWRAEQGECPALRLASAEQNDGFALPVAQSPEDDLKPLFSLLPLGSILPTNELNGNIEELNSLLEIIVQKQLRAQFQPIVNLRDGSVLAYEALIRGPKTTLLRRGGQMFQAADKARMVSWYDIACLDQCFAQAVQLGLRHLLFVNMDAEGLSYLDVYERSFAQCAREAGVSPARIVIEITERQTVGDFPQLIKYIERLREEGFKIAIDDAGAGYNSLHAIAELRPEFVKVDRNMVRNLDAHGERRALLAALVDYARHIGTAVLAEGAETREELSTLIDLGVSYGQGYLMGRPADEFRGIPRHTREFIQQRAQQRLRMTTGQSVQVGKLARKGLTLPPEEPLETAARHFAKDASLTSVVIVEEDYPRGLLMRGQVEHVLNMASAAQVGELLPAETVAQWMRTNVLFAPEDASAAEVARQVTTRSDLRLDMDVVIVRQDGKYIGLLPARQLLEAAMTVEENRQRYAEPLTGLPGRVVLEQSLRERLTGQCSLAVLRADLDHFEPFNRRYGVAHGDAMIQALASLLQEVSAAHGCEDDLLAHLGGDDFVLLTEAASAEPICRALMDGFAKIVPQFYTAEQCRLGYMEVEEWGGGTRRVPMANLSVVAQTNRHRRLTHPAQIMEGLYPLLRAVRSLPGSRYAIDTPPEKRK